jgi:uncharacterized membrane protein YjgN (DUF898 family)
MPSRANVTTRNAALGRRAGASLAVSSAVLHGVSLGHGVNLVAEAVMVTMIAACLYCACDLWLHGTIRAWVLVAVMNLVMIGIHLPAMSAHHHGARFTPIAPSHGATAMTLATGVAIVEVLLAAGVLWSRTRAWAPTDARYPPEGSELT